MSGSRAGAIALLVALALPAVLLADSTFRRSTHLGTEYAALLVDAEYRPPAKTASRPGTGGGVAALAVTAGTPPWYRAGWFQAAGVMLAVLGGIAWHRHHLHRIAQELDARSEERLVERTRIAQELYDTLLQGFLSASMQLHLAADQLPEGSPDRARLEHILGVMGRATDEGRRVLQGLRCGDDEAERLETSLERLGGSLGPAAAVQYRVAVEGAGERLRPVIRDEVYQVAREAVMNAFRHARARTVAVDVEYSARGLRLVVRDDGCGIDPAVLASMDEGDGGLPGMRKRAARIGASLRMRRGDGGGTEVELSVPKGVAFPPSETSSRRETNA
jgi:signal transduction histidine kinase